MMKLDYMGVFENNGDNGGTIVITMMKSGVWDGDTLVKIITSCLLWHDKINNREKK